MRTQQSKRATVYLEPELHKALKIKSAQIERTISDLVNSAVRQSLAEDYKDLTAFEEKKDEPNLDFEEVLKELKASDKAVLDAFYREVGPKESKKIKAVARDLISSTKEHAPDALIVLDHFHVKKYLNDAVDQIRKVELKKGQSGE